MASIVKCLFEGRAVGLSKARLLRESKQSEETITVRNFLHAFLNFQNVPLEKNGLYCVFVDSVEIHGDELLVDISPAWQEINFEIKLSGQSEFGAGPGPGPATSGHEADDTPSAGKEAPTGHMQWFRCFVGQIGFPVVLFPEMANLRTLGDLRQQLRVCHGFRAADLSIEVVIANTFAVLLNDTQLVEDLWPSQEKLCVYYSLSTAEPSSRLNPCSFRAGSGDRAAQLVPLSTDSGVQLLLACLYILSRDGGATDPASPGFSIGTILFNVQLHSQCPALTSLLAAHLCSPQSPQALSLATGPFLSQGLYFLFQTLVCQHVSALRLSSPTVVATKTCTLLENSRECFAFLLAAPLTATGTSNILDIKQVKFIPENVSEAAAKPRQREFVVLEAAASASAAGATPQPEVFDVDVLAWIIANHPTRQLVGQPAQAWAAVLPTLPRDPLLPCLFRSRAVIAADRSTLYFTLSPTERSGARPSPIHDLSLYQRLVNSPDSMGGLLRVVNLRSLRSQRKKALTIRGDGAVAVFRSSSKDMDKVNVLNPLNPTHGDESCKFETEAVELQTWLSAHPASFAARISAVGSAVGSPSQLPTIEDSRPVTEAVVVLLDCSGSMSSVSAFPAFSRLQLCQQTLRAFVDRLTGYDYPFRAQLSLFSDAPRVVCPFTSIYARFTQHIAAAKVAGGTALFDAIVLSCKDLGRFSTGHPSLLFRRLFVLSDGEDQNSSASVADALAELRSAGVVLDSVCIGSDGDFKNIKALCLASGGLCFKTSSTEELFHLFESEPMLSVQCRPLLQPIAGDAATVLNFQAKSPYSTMPKRPLPPQVQSSILSSAAALVQAQRLACPPPNSSPAFRAVLRALAAYERDPHPLLRLYPSDATITFWMFTMSGASGTPYEGGSFLGFIQFPDDFPTSPPTVRLLTPMYHCNVNSDGKVCHSVLDRNWSRDTSVRCVFDCIYGLMLAADPDDPLDTNIASLYYSDKAQYEAKARQCTRDFAAKSFQEVLGPIAHLSERACEQLTRLHPPHLSDPLTCELLEDPVITPSGVTYSRASIMAALERKAEDPTTRTPLTAAALIPNRLVATQVEEYRQALKNLKDGEKEMWWAS